MNNIKHFKTPQNIALLWDVFLDELQLTYSNKELIANIRSVFESNIGPFTGHANQTASIMELNKQFLKQIVMAVYRLFPHLKDMKRITITDEELSSPYKIEDIQALRQNDFEREFEKKQIEMDSYLTVKKPQQMNFALNNYEEKITSMDSLIAEKMAQRNAEILPPLQDSEQWLQSRETSIKTEKMQNINNNTNNNNTNNNNSRLKYISIDNDNNNIVFKEKRVTWIDEEPSNNIFEKLKKMPQEITETKQYIEQQSIALPEMKQKTINKTTTQNQNQNQVPIIPKNELVTQINELNKKVDAIQELIINLTNLIKDNCIIKTNSV